jgi:hypothetical protein
MARDARAGRVERAVPGGARRVPRAVPIAEHGLIGGPHTVALAVATE